MTDVYIAPRLSGVSEAPARSSETNGQQGPAHYANLRHPPPGNFGPRATTEDSDDRSFFQRHKVAIIVGIIVICIFLLVLYLYWTRRAGSGKKREELSPDGGEMQEVNMKEVEKLRALRRRRRASQQPADQQSADQQPADQQPAGQQPAGQQPTNAISPPQYSTPRRQSSQHQPAQSSRATEPQMGRPSEAFGPQDPPDNPATEFCDVDALCSAQSLGATEPRPRNPNPPAGSQTDQPAAAPQAPAPNLDQDIDEILSSIK